jgi:hypothetical protein
MFHLCLIKDGTVFPLLCQTNPALIMFKIMKDAAVTIVKQTVRAHKQKRIDERAK